ncbi:Uncharacterized conserved protein UCP032025 [Rhodomicrobium vannielii ATCC 17100]|uniref:Uncharacterized conserved protein UCP032025 n=1 Tax=Rhodomicrobium vannielii (strain ATCC 17100 / DSM 162 / LMG 4299 / NCIMB 10020 / ATH 3.1.1) TaxID=648757 RepID=E3I4K3_RHOVT|nr:DUF1489 domain-containing protein [Rhodomicrobium vannielii]ADP71585.1 Uncharacterized conserved protein UCP032025 [Rhodomicrobium vannielii ATCC 17100]
MPILSSPSIHILKLCVGCDNVEMLADWQKQRIAAGHALIHTTRQTPRRDGFSEGSSLYWVMGGFVRVRQRIVALHEIRGADGIMRCGFELDPQLVLTEPVPRRAFQGWRYLSASEAPRDLIAGAIVEEGAMPPEMRAALAELALI